MGKTTSVLVLGAVWFGSTLAAAQVDPDNPGGPSESAKKKAKKAKAPDKKVAKKSDKDKDKEKTATAK